LGAPPAGMLICALLLRSHAGGPTGLGIFACMKNTDDQPIGTFTGAALMLQVSTGPAWPQFHPPKTTPAVTFTPSVSLTWIGPVGPHAHGGVGQKWRLAPAGLAGR